MVRKVDLDELKRLHAQGLNDCQIAELLGVGRATVGDWRRKLGLSPNRTRRRAPKVNLDELRRLHAQGLSDRKMAELLGVGQATVGDWRRKIGLPPNRPPVCAKRKIDLDELRRLCERGVGDEEIARMLGVSPLTVAYYRSGKLGIRKRERWSRTREMVERLAKAGFGADEIAEVLGLSPSRARNVLYRLGLSSVPNAFKLIDCIRPGERLGLSDFVERLGLWNDERTERAIKRKLEFWAKVGVLCERNGVYELNIQSPYASIADGLYEEWVEEFFGKRR